MAPELRPRSRASGETRMLDTKRRAGRGRGGGPWGRVVRAPLGGGTRSNNNTEATPPARALWEDTLAGTHWRGGGRGVCVHACACMCGRDGSGTLDPRGHCTWDSRTHANRETLVEGDSTPPPASGWTLGWTPILFTCVMKGHSEQYTQGSHSYGTNELVRPQGLRHSSPPLIHAHPTRSWGS